MGEVKKIITRFNFKDAMLDGRKAHVALVDEGANEQTVLTLKQNNDEVRVDMSMQNFLRAFFNMYSTDAEALAMIMGFDIPEFEGFDNEAVVEQMINDRIGMVSLLKNKSEIPDKLPAPMVTLISDLQKQIGDKLKTSEGSTSEDLKKSLEGESSMTEEEIKAMETELEDLRKAAKEKSKLETELADLRKAKADKEMAEAVDLVKSFHLFETESTIKSVSEFVVKNNNETAMKDILKAFEASRKAVEAFGEEEQGIDLQGEQKDVSKSASTQEQQVIDAVGEMIASRKSK